MKSQQQVRWGTAVSDSYIGPEGQITVDTDRKEIRLHDGVKPGGHRFLNESQIQAYGSLLFTAVVPIGMVAHTNLNASAARKYHSVSAVGGTWNLRLPDLAAFDIGMSLLVEATSDNVVLIPLAGQGWRKAGVDTVNFVYPIPLGQILTLTKLSPTRWIVTNVQ